MYLALSIGIGKSYMQKFKVFICLSLLRIFKFSNLWILLRKVLMTNIHPEVILTSFKHLAFHWVQQFFMFKFTKRGIVTLLQPLKAVLCGL